MVVVVTGVTGFIGWHVAEAFAREGRRVIGVVRPGSRKAVPGGIEIVEAALDAAALAPAIGRASLVVHAAGLARAARPSTLEATNVAGTAEIVEAANAAGARLIYVSSQAASGIGTADRPSREEEPGRPLTPYGFSKAAAERVVTTRARGAWTIVRPSSVYGPRDRQFLPFFRLAARGLFPLPARPTLAFTLVHVEDVVRAIVQAASDDRAIAETFFLGHPVPVAVSDFVLALAAAFNRPCRMWPVPRPVMRAMASVGELSWRVGRQPAIDRARIAELDAAGFVCSVDRARDVMGFRASVELHRGLADTAAWYAAHGWL